MEFKDKENMDTTTTKETKNVPNETIKCDTIESMEKNATTSEHEAPKEIKSHDHLPICQEKIQRQKFLAYGEGEEIHPRKEDECNYDLGILFAKENETIRSKNDGIIETSQKALNKVDVVKNDGIKKISQEIVVSKNDITGIPHEDVIENDDTKGISQKQCWLFIAAAIFAAGILQS